jgi:transcriptional regulator with XRE-family HTH domain
MQWLAKLSKKKAKAQNKLLGELLALARQEKKMTQTKAAAHLVRDQTFIARIESGSKKATFVEVELLAQAYGKQLSDFQTFSQIELQNRNFAMRPEWIADYTAESLRKQKRRRKSNRQQKQNRNHPKQHQRKRR